MWTGWKKAFPGRKQGDVEKRASWWLQHKQKHQDCLHLGFGPRLPDVCHPLAPTAAEGNFAGEEPGREHPAKVEPHSHSRQSKTPSFPQRHCCQRQGHFVPAEGEAHGWNGSNGWCDDNCDLSSDINSCSHTTMESKTITNFPKRFCNIKVLKCCCFQMWHKNDESNKDFFTCSFSACFTALLYRIVSALLFWFVYDFSCSWWVMGLLLCLLVRGT